MRKFIGTLIFAALVAGPAASASMVYPMCYIEVATDVSNPAAVIRHEQEHCWGMPEKHKPAQLAPGWKVHGPYPANRVVIYFELSRDVAKECADKHGCMWGGMQP